ncbi:MAG: hypothetical protein AAF581_05175 [Planctomycetota bacterium]
MRQFFEKLLSRDPLDTVLLLTLLLVAVNPGESLMLHASIQTSSGPLHADGSVWLDWLLLVSTAIVGVSGILSPQLRSSAALWFTLGGLLAVVNVWHNWHFSDNHKFVICYWCFGLGICQQLRDPARGAAWTGRILVGLVFGVATLWKVTSLGYLDGSTFQFLLITDERFFAMAHALAGFTTDMFEANRLVLTEELAKPTQLLPTVQYVAAHSLQTTESIPALAVFLTWWTILIEGAIAVLFLIDRGEKWEKWRHGVLLFFIFTTYPPTSVIKFGWILVIMALAAVPSEWRRTRTAYLFLFLYIYVFAESFLRNAYFSWAKG